MATYSTLAAAETALDENMDYAETASATKAKLFASAARYILAHKPKRSKQGDVEVEYDPGILREQMNAAIQFANEAGGGSLIDLSLEEFRG